MKVSGFFTLLPGSTLRSFPVGRVVYFGYPPLSEVVPPSTPVHLEVGCGKGEFLLEMAVRFPGIYLVGVEQAGEYFFSTMKRLEKKGSPHNISLYYLDVRAFLRWFVPQDFLTEVWINFPDPWPKKRHRHRRLSSPEFCQLLLSRLKPGGGIHFITDVRDFVGELAYSFLSQKVAPLGSYDPWQRRRIGAETRYERKWSQAGKSFYFFEVRKIASGNCTYPFTPHETPWELFPDHFPSPGVWQEDDTILKVFSGFKHKPSRHHFLFITRKDGFKFEGWFDEEERWCVLYGPWDRSFLNLWRKATGFWKS